MSLKWCWQTAPLNLKRSSWTSVPLNKSRITSGPSACAGGVQAFHIAPVRKNVEEEFKRKKAQLTPLTRPVLFVPPCECSVSIRSRNHPPVPCCVTACSCPCRWRGSCGWSSVDALRVRPGWCREGDAAGRNTSGPWGDRLWAAGRGRIDREELFR